MNDERRRGYLPSVGEKGGTSRRVATDCDSTGWLVLGPLLILWGKEKKKVPFYFTVFSVDDWRNARQHQRQKNDNVSLLFLVPNAWTGLSFCFTPLSSAGT